MDAGELLVYSGATQIVESAGTRMEKPGTITDRAAVDVIYDQDFVVIYQGLDQALCDTVIELFKQDTTKWQGKIGSAGEARHEKDTKISWDLEILNEGVWRDAFQRLHPPIQACLSDYVSRSPILQSFHLQATGYKIQMYPQGEGRFLWHADSVGTHGSGRVVAMVLYLNDVERGGETEFFHQGLKVSPKAGCLMLFPTGWNYMHCGHTPESGDKYIISTFIKTKP